MKNNLKNNEYAMGAQSMLETDTPNKVTSRGFLGFGKVSVAPTIRRLRIVTGNSQAGASKLRVLDLNERGSPDCSTWRLMSDASSDSMYAKKGVELWYHQESGIAIKVKGDRISSVSVNLSQLLSGYGQGEVFKDDQEGVDQALTMMWDILDLVSSGERSGRFYRVEFGGIIEHAYTNFELLLKSRNLPLLRKAPLIRPGESMQFGAAQRAQMTLLLCDKGRQLNSKNCRRRIVKQDVDRFTELKLMLTGKKLGKAFNDGECSVGKLVHSEWADLFFEVLYSLDPDDSCKVALIGDDFLGFLAEMDKYPDLSVAGVHPVDLYLAQVPKVFRQQIRNSMSLIHSREVSLRDMVPCDPMLPKIDLVPVPMDEVKNG